MNDNPEFIYYDINEFKKYLLSIPKKDSAKLLALINKIEVLGIQESIKMQWVAKLDDNLYEIRSKLGSNIQRALYFHYIDNQYVITHGFTKKTQKTPKKELDLGNKIKKDYFNDM